MLLGTTMGSFVTLNLLLWMWMWRYQHQRL